MDPKSRRCLQMVLHLGRSFPLSRTSIEGRPETFFLHVCNLASNHLGRAQVARALWGFLRHVGTRVADQSPRPHAAVHFLPVLAGSGPASHLQKEIREEWRLQRFACTTAGV